MRIVRKVKEMKRCKEKEWVLLWMKRGGKAVVEDKTRCNNTPVARARERERERERDGCIPPWLFPPPSAASVLSGMQPSRHIRNEF
jgi:hypothetical protein